MFTFKSGNTRADIVAEFKSALTERNTKERLAAMNVVHKDQRYDQWVGNRSRVDFTDRYGYHGHKYSPIVVEQTGSASYAFGNCMSAILQGFSPTNLTDNEFSELLAIIMNHIGRDSHTFYCLPADYQLVDGKAAHSKQCQKGDFLDRWVNELGALEIDRTPNMYHAPSYGVMFRLCLLYNPNILQYLDCIPVDAWTQDTSTRRHFYYVPKYRVDAELTKEVVVAEKKDDCPPEETISGQLAAKRRRLQEVQPQPEAIRVAPASATNARTSF